MNVRRAGAGDTPAIVALRMALFRESSEAIGAAPDAALAAATRRYFERAPTESGCHTWVVELAGEVVAAGSLAHFVRPPYPGNEAGREAYLLNMYTPPEQRGKGCARAIFERIMAFARAEGYGKVWLHATRAGRPLYESAGFAPAPTYLEWTPRHAVAAKGAAGPDGRTANEENRNER